MPLWCECTLPLSKRSRRAARMNVTKRKRLSLMWMSDLSNCGNQSQQWTLTHFHRTLRHLLWLWHIWQPTLQISLLLPLFLAGLSCRSVWSYDGELKWSGRKSYWCLSKYHTWVHLDWTKHQFQLLKPFIICFMSCLRWHFLLTNVCYNLTY